MKKVSKMILIITIVITFVIIPQVSFARKTDGLDKYISEGSDLNKGSSSGDKYTYSEGEKVSEDISTWTFGIIEEIPTKVIDIIGVLLHLARTVCIILTVLVLTILGIKFMIGSVQEKAEYKKAYTNIIIGVVLITMVTSIIDAIYSMSVGISSSV